RRHTRFSRDWSSDVCSSDLSEGVPSLLDPRVCGGDHTGLLVLYSMSKQSNLAGYRAAFAAGDPALIGRLLEIRKHAGMMVPGPRSEERRVGKEGGERGWGAQ